MLAPCITPALSVILLNRRTPHYAAPAAVPCCRLAQLYDQVLARTKGGRSLAFAAAVVIQIGLWSCRRQAAVLLPIQRARPDRLEGTTSQPEMNRIVAGLELGISSVRCGPTWGACSETRWSASITQVGSASICRPLFETLDSIQDTVNSAGLDHGVCAFQIPKDASRDQRADGQDVTACALGATGPARLAERVRQSISGSGRAICR
jgi:hypothetical protein